MAWSCSTHSLGHVRESYLPHTLRGPYEGEKMLTTSVHSKLVIQTVPDLSLVYTTHSKQLDLYV